MTQLIDLLHGLTEVLIRYHDYYASPHFVSKSNPNPDSAYRDRSKSISHANNLNTQLEDIIHTILEKRKDKNQLLTYLKEDILFLNNLINRNTSVFEEQLEEDKNILIRMLIEIKQLILTQKTSQCTITLINTDSKVSISGALQCESGNQLERFFKKLNLSKDSSPDEITRFIDELCTNHQNQFLVSELRQKIEEQNNAQSTLENQLKSITEAQNQATIQISSLQLEGVTLKDENEKLKLKLAEFETSLNEKKAELESADAQIAALIAHSNTSKPASKIKHQRATAPIPVSEPGEQPLVLSKGEPPRNIMGSLRGFGSLYYNPALFAGLDSSAAPPRPPNESIESSENTADSSQTYYFNERW